MTPAPMVSPGQQWSGAGSSGPGWPGQWPGPQCCDIAGRKQQGGEGDGGADQGGDHICTPWDP